MYTQPSLVAGVVNLDEVNVLDVQIGVSVHWAEEMQEDGVPPVEATLPSA